ncbi:MAG: YeeE/YedE thiosulfate transporter family protein [Burkholderiales bacterium]
MTVHNFTPLSALGGGLLIGLAAALTWGGLGRIAGISNILGQFLAFQRGHWGWRAAFLAGLLVTGVAARAVLGETLDFQLEGGAVRMIAAGALVGIGTQLANGCTSGHGVCGIGRLSPRSIVATLVFMATGGLVIWLLRASGALS